jgi:hypothetical protein
MKKMDAGGLAGLVAGDALSDTHDVGRPYIGIKV